MSRLTRDGTAKTPNLRRERGQGNNCFPCSADHEQDWQPYAVDPYSCYMCDHTCMHAPRQPLRSSLANNCRCSLLLCFFLVSWEVSSLFPGILYCCCRFHFFFAIMESVCVCVFFLFILDIKFVGRTSRGYTGRRSHRIFHLSSFCGACLKFSREKDSAIPFPCRP